MASLNPHYPLLPASPGEKRQRSQERDGWLLRWKDHRGRWRSKIFRGNKRSGEKFLARIVAEVDEIAAGLKPPPETAFALSKAVQIYLRHLEGSNRAPATVIR